MKRLILLIALAAVVLADPWVGHAQTKKALQRTNMHGQVVQFPYVSYDEFQSVTVSSPSGKVSLQELLTVSSLDEVIRLLGEPQSIERNEDPDNRSFSARLHYEGNTIVVYDASSDGETVSLRTLELWSPRWSLVVGDKVLRPGMKVGSLSPAVRQSIQAGSWFSEEGIDHFGSVDIMKPDATANTRC